MLTSKNIATKSLGLLLTSFIFLPVAQAKPDPILYCDICRAVIAETRVAIQKIPADKKTRIVEGQGRLGSDGALKTKSKLIPLAHSREWLEDLFEDRVCKTVGEDYIKWFDGKDHKQWRIGRVMSFEGTMNTDIDLAYIQQGTGEAREIVEKDPNDRTRTIRWYCENAVELMEELLYSYYVGAKNKDGIPTRTICQEAMEWCEGERSEEMYKLPVVEKKSAKKEQVGKEEL